MSIFGINTKITSNGMLVAEYCAMRGCCCYNLRSTPMCVVCTIIKHLRMQLSVINIIIIGDKKTLLLMTEMKMRLIRN